MMTLTAALTRARSRVAIVPQGRGQYVLQAWSPRHNATYVHRHLPINYSRARAAMRELLIGDALEALGVTEPYAEASSLTDNQGRWDRIVADYWREHR